MPDNKPGISIQEHIRLWVNGHEKKNAYIQTAQIVYPDLFGPKIVQDDIQANNTKDCLSQWTEHGVKCFTYNPSMKNAPVKLRRLNRDIYVNICLRFIGPLADQPFVDIDAAGKTTALKETYADVAYAGITREWRDNTFRSDKNNFFGDYESIDWHVTVNRLTKDSPIPHLRVKIEEKGQPMCLYNILWSIGGNQSKNPMCDVTLCAFFGQRVWKEAFMNLAAHEIGHSLGLGDAYEGFTQKGVSKTDHRVMAEVPLDDVMRSDWNNVEVNANTVEMILEAFKTNSLQRYDPRFHSEVIHSY
ncbi:MAG: hypothetical protein LBS84_04800 [Clostridiales bacterium]|jgi:hypothetical protein|nr:hypothetical protein [Clostridiales bacterium]